MQPTDQTVLPAFDRAAETEPGRLHGTFNGVPVTIGALHRRSAAVAASLASRGIGPGHRVAVMMRNSPAVAATILGIVRAGAAWVPVNVQLVGDGLRYILDHADPALLIADRALLPAVQQAGASLPILAAGGTEAADELEALLAQPAEFATLPAAPSDPFAIMYTSGTTGRPKGVLVSHRMMRLSAEGAMLLSGAGDGNVLFVWEPLYHIGGAQVLLIPFLRRASLALVDRFSASRFWAQVTEAGATHIHYLGGILQLLLKQPPGPQDRAHGVRIAWGGGCRPEIWRPFEQRFGVVIRECYGMTEASSFSTINLDGTVGSVGRPLPWFDVSICGPAGEPLPAGERGEIVVAPREPDCITEGYFRNPEATAKALRGGRLHTGDVGSFDAAGRLAYHGRLVDSLRCRGENVSAWEIEHVVNTHPDIDDSAAIGVGAEVGEQDILLFVQPRPGAAIDPAALSDWLAPLLAAFQRPRYIVVTGALPRTPSQRVKKHELSRSTAGIWDRMRRA